VWFFGLVQLASYWIVICTHICANITHILNNCKFISKYYQMIIYDNPAQYLESAGSDLKARINRLTVIINGLENMMVIAASNGNILSYQFNDGQSQINTTYRTLKDVTDALNAFETIRTRLINKASGRTNILRDADTVPRRVW
jgi:hypothetical protein